MYGRLFSICAVAALLLCPGSLEAKQRGDSIPARELIHPKLDCSTYDSIIASWRIYNMNEAFDNFTQEYINLDTSQYVEAVTPFTDEQYQTRLRGVVSPIHLPYNQIVRKHLVAYVTTHRALTRRMLGQSQYYFPIIERELEKAGLPLELKFLPVIESALQPSAVSPGGAVGMWQFTLNTGRHYGLEISSMVDERRDPVASTRAACAYLKDLYKIYGDWTLAIASYNYGPGNVNKALKRAGGNARTYWDIYPYLPTATRDYIPAFVGLTYAYHYYKEHHIKPFTPPLPLATDTVTISRNLHLEQVASALNVPLELLQGLNPQYKQNIIPAATRSYPLILPQREITHFLDHEQEIYAKESAYLSDHLNVAPATSEAAPVTKVASKVATYKIRKGDTLGAVAAKHGVTTAQLMQWNNLKSANRLQIGQTLKVSR